MVENAIGFPPEQNMREFMLKFRVPPEKEAEARKLYDELVNWLFANRVSYEAHYVNWPGWRV